MQDQFDRLLRCQPVVIGGRVHPIDGAALHWLAKDAFKLYIVVSVILLNVVDNITKLSLEQAQICLKQSQHFYGKELPVYKAWASDCLKWRLVDREFIPDFENISTSLLPILEELCRTLTDNPKDEAGEVESKSSVSDGPAGATSPGEKKFKQKKKAGEKKKRSKDASEVQRTPTDFDPFGPPQPLTAPAAVAAAAAPAPASEPSLFDDEFAEFDPRASARAATAPATAPAASVAPGAATTAGPRADPFSLDHLDPLVSGTIGPAPPRRNVEFDPFSDTAANTSFDPFVVGPVSAARPVPARAPHVDPFAGLHAAALTPATAVGPMVGGHLGAHAHGPIIGSHMDAHHAHPHVLAPMSAPPAHSDPFSGLGFGAPAAAQQSKPKPDPFAFL